MWAKRMAVSDDRADHAEGMATAMDVSVKQLEAQLALRQQEVAARDGEQQGRLAKGTTSGRAEPPTWLDDLPAALSGNGVHTVLRHHVCMMVVCAPVLLLCIHRGGGQAAVDAGACSTDGRRRCCRSKGLYGLPEQAGACRASSAALSWSGAHQRCPPQ